MADELVGKVAVVTGGASGIGRGIVEVFAQEGARVVVGDVDEAAGVALAAELGDRVRFKRCDVAERAQVQALVDHALAEFGGLQVMVNNAAISGMFVNRFLDDDLADFDRVMHVDVAGTMYGTQCAARHMRDHGGGSIVNLSSIASLNPGFAIPTYRAAKAGVNNFTRSMAIDLGEYGIRVNAIAPGAVPTRMGSFADPALPPEQSAELERRLDTAWLASQPIKRRGSPRDIANAALFFASDRSTYVTGQILGVDGGGSAGEMTNRNAMMRDIRDAFYRDRKG
jgi:NAD(P)-dependent dehydrogenase (short-subunit alcohol dehydrogenase family)